MAGKEGRYIKWFSELSNKDIPVAGSKGASLAEMYNNKFPVPSGFVVTTEAYKYFIEKNKLQEPIMNILKETNIEDMGALTKNAARIRELIESAEMPLDLKNLITDAYGVLDVGKNQFTGASEGALDILKTGHEPPFVAVRSSATTEDLENASFAGQQETFLNVKGDDNLIRNVKKTFAALFTDRAIYYRAKKGFVHEQSYLAVVIQKMIDSDKSGVIFSKNPVRDDDNIVIEAVLGLGEGVVSGRISPDHYIVNENLEVVKEKIANKKIALTRNSSGKTEVVKLKPEISKKEVLTGHEIKILSQFARRLEGHYKIPQDIEFAISNGEIFIVQSRPITTNVKEDNKEIGGNVLFSGLPASSGVGSGVIKVVGDFSELNKIQPGNVLVTKITNPDILVGMQKSAAIITDEGGMTSRAAIVSREMGIPAVVGTKIATEKLQDGQVVTVDGVTGRIIEGEGVERKVEIKEIVPTKKTKIKVIIDLPDYAKRAAKSRAKGVGLVRLETVIATSGKHPIWFIKNGKLDEYTRIINNGLRKISQPFEEIWIRTTDLRSDEYGNLEGAPVSNEQNPMLGDRGIRFGLRNEDLLKAEFAAIKELADEYGNKTFGIMLPKIISVREFKGAKRIASDVGFSKNIKLGVMVETPAAVQIIDDLCEAGVEFISLGTNDLTQYTLAIDRNNENVQDLFDETNPAILNSLKHVIKQCKKYGVETSICGQVGSNPEMAEFLASQGIDSISVNADSAYEISERIAKFERSIAEGSDGPIKQEPTVAVQQPVKNVNEEELILKALNEGNDNYQPSLDKKEDDVPVLNEAIPVESEHLEEDKEDFVEVDEIPEEEKEEIIDDKSEDNEVDEMLSEEEIEEDEEEEIFEEQEEKVLEAEIEEEVKESEVREEFMKQLGSGQEGDKEEKGSEENKEKVLDIF